MENYTLKDPILERQISFIYALKVDEYFRAMTVRKKCFFSHGCHEFIQNLNKEKGVKKNDC